MNNFTLFKAIRAKAILHRDLYESFEYWQDKDPEMFGFVAKMARPTVYESENRNIYTLDLFYHPTIDSITAKACKFPEDTDYYYTVTFRYRDGSEKFWNKDGIRWYKAWVGNTIFTDFKGGINE